MDIIIPFLILCGFAALIVYSSIKDARRKRHKKKPEEQQTHYAHPPMDLRLKNDPCETKEANNHE